MLEIVKISIFTLNDIILKGSVEVIKISGMNEDSLRRVQAADMLYRRIVAMSSSFIKYDDIGEIERFKEEANLLLNGIKGLMSLSLYLIISTMHPYLKWEKKNFGVIFLKCQRPDEWHRLWVFLKKSIFHFLQTQ